MAPRRRAPYASRAYVRRPARPAGAWASLGWPSGARASDRTAAQSRCPRARKRASACELITTRGASSAPPNLRISHVAAPSEAMGGRPDAQTHYRAHNTTIYRQCTHSTVPRHVPRFCVRASFLIVRFRRAASTRAPAVLSPRGRREPHFTAWVIVDRLSWVLGLSCLSRTRSRPVTRPSRVCVSASEAERL